jgi:hypothetical protein
MSAPQLILIASAGPVVAAAIAARPARGEGLDVTGDWIVVRDAGRGNHCSDRVAQTILTSEPWRRTDR